MGWCRTGRGRGWEELMATSSLPHRCLTNRCIFFLRIREKRGIPCHIRLQSSLFHIFEGEAAKMCTQSSHCTPLILVQTSRQKTEIPQPPTLHAHAGTWLVCQRILNIQCFYNYSVNTNEHAHPWQETLGGSPHSFPTHAHCWCLRLFWMKGSVVVNSLALLPAIKRKSIQTAFRS